MKRISFALVVCVILTAIYIPASAETNVNDGMLGVLSYLDIMSGDPDGNMRLDDPVSRAEFSKMAVASSAYKNMVAAGLALSPFPDVTYKHWAAPYVRVAVTNNIVSGYPDGTFSPDNTVLYEEAVTMMLRVLGYQDSDFGNSWPLGQLGIADNIDLTEYMDCEEGNVLTRRDVARLVYNSLKTEIKDQNQTLSAIVFDVTISEEAAIVATHNEDSAISSDSVLTSNGTYKLDFDINRSYVGMKGDIAVKNNKKLIGFVPEEDAAASEEYVVYSVLNDKILAYRNGGISQINISDSTTVYKGTNVTTFGQIKSSLELGDKVNIKRLSAGDIDYIICSDGNLLGPVTALGGNWQSLWNVPQGVKVTRNGTSVTTSDIKSYDILYYISDMNMIMAYNNKVTGIFEAATPNRDAPTAITVSGKTYTLESGSAFNKVVSGGNFEYGDTITLLLGKEGEIADVIDPSANTERIVGYVIGTGIKEYADGDINTFKNYYIKVVGTDGIEYEYITDKDYSERLNSIVEVSFANGDARLGSVNKVSVGGTFDWNSKRLGTDKVSSNINIIDVGTTDSSDTSMYKKIFGQRLDGVEISTGKILYAYKNSSGEITDLILYDVTGDAFSYGLVMSASVNGNDMRVSSSYTYMVGGDRYSTSVSGNYNVSRGSAVKISGSPSRPDGLSQINQISGAASSITAEKLVTGGKTYLISDGVSCYKVNSGTANEYSMISLNDIIENKSNYNITAFYDKSSETGGRVRVIVVTEKN